MDQPPITSRSLANQLLNPCSLRRVIKARITVYTTECKDKKGV